MASQLEVGTSSSSDSPVLASDAVPKQEPSAVLQVSVTEAQGLRLMRGGEIRLVLTLRATDDVQGEAFGAKVTPWLAVPETEAPQWRPRTAFFEVPFERLRSEEFLESAHLHIALWQRGHEQPVVGGLMDAVTSKAPAGLGVGVGLFGTKAKSLATAFQQSAQNAFVPGGYKDRGCLLAELSVSVGTRFTTSVGCAREVENDGTWAELMECSSGEGGKVKGSLLLYLETLYKNSPPPESLASAGEVKAGADTSESVAVEDRPGDYAIKLEGTAVTSALVPSKETITNELQSGTIVSVLELTELHDIQRLRARIVSPPGWISVLDTSNGNRWAVPYESNLSNGTIVATPSVDVHESHASEVDAAAISTTARTNEAEPALEPDLPSAPHRDDASEGASSISEGGHTLDASASHGSSCSTAATRNRLEEDQVAAPIALSLRVPLRDPDIFEPESPAKWLPFGPESREESKDNTFDASSKMDIFAASDPNDGDRPPILRKLAQLSTKPSGKMRLLRDKLRFALDPSARKERKQVRKWRRWHEIFCSLNDIERRLAEVLELLVQAAASIKRFGEEHGAIQDDSGVPAFLRDAGLYFKSEAELPRRLERRLGELEIAADEFRSISLEALAAGAARGEDELADANTDEFEDMQVDVAVLLESALMASQQALAEYKKLHCRLELLATEYGTQVDAADPTFLPLLDESPSAASVGAVPTQAVEWAYDFSQQVGKSSRHLEGLVRELDDRMRHLKSCATEMRDTMMNKASCDQLGTLKS